MTDKTNETDVKIAELVAKFEQAVIDHGHFYQAHRALNLKRGRKLSTELFNSMEDARAKRDRYRLELLQFVSNKEAAE